MQNDRCAQACLQAGKPSPLCQGHRCRPMGAEDNKSLSGVICLLKFKLLKKSHSGWHHSTGLVQKQLGDIHLNEHLQSWAEIPHRTVIAPG